ncbi:MAG TPA: YibE/F family protein [Chloroflexi bacterium]|nr:YibE/F family protein [Chloroflexota bacterium]
MRKLERWLVVGLGALIVLTVVLLVAGPLLERRAGPTEESLASGETETMPARVLEVVEEGTVDLGGGSTQPYQRLLLRVESGSLAGQEVLVEEGMVNIIGQQRLFHPGDRVYLARAVGPEGDRFYISDYVRTGPLFWIVVLFMGLVVLVGRGKGLRSLAGTLFSLAVIFAFVLPQIMAGRDPVGISIAGSILLLAVSTYFVYGWTPKAHAAMAGMVVSLVLVGMLAWLFVGWARLSGLAAEESGYLVMELGPGIDLRGLVLGGIIIGSLGVLDDICVGQASAVFELVNANRDLGWVDLFRRSLNIGQDHIAAMVNTLLLAYVGVSMPLMLVFTMYQEPLWQRLNREPIAEEIVRTLVGSVGLVLAVPATSLVASLLARWTVRREVTRGQRDTETREQGNGEIG